MNKSERIREYVKKHPGQTPLEIATALGDGISNQLVSVVTSKDRKKRKKAAEAKAEADKPLWLKEDEIEQEATDQVLAIAQDVIALHALCDTYGRDRLLKLIDSYCHYEE